MAINRHELLVFISKRHKEWIADGESRSVGSILRGIAIGNAMALEELHKWVKEQPSVIERVDTDLTSSNSITNEETKDGNHGQAMQ